MPEKNNPGFRGTWIPASIHEIFEQGHIDAADMVLLATIDSLCHHGQRGCIASNAWLAKKMRIDETNISKRISKLKKKGLVQQVAFDGRRRQLEVTYNPTHGTTPHVRLGANAKADLARTPRPLTIGKTKVKTHSPPEGGGGNGFELEKPQNTTTTEFDQQTATTLKQAVKKLLPRKTGIKSANPATWTNHIRLLRTKDEISEDAITKTLAWYALHIGEEFVPQAYSGESFRKKFLAIEKQALRHEEEIVEVGSAANRVAERLAGLGWPKGAGSKVPGAAQVCINRYATWCGEVLQFVERLDADDLVNDYGKKLIQHQRAGAYLRRTIPPPEVFTQQWLEAVFERVANWEAWSGDLGPMCFRADAKRFQAIGRGWFQHYGGADGWDRFLELMKDES